MNLRNFLTNSEPRTAWRRGLLMVIVGVLLIGVALGLHAWMSASGTPSGIYRVTGIYGQGGFAEPAYLQTITVRHNGLVLEGGSGGIVTGKHRIRQVNGPLVLICAAQQGASFQARISKNHQKIRVQVGQCLVEGRRS
ncbi:hypothetical protein [Acidithiobacillus sp.]|uniref:hypothetical protein n=1 Tax=Acidithiobacillus sp. TaxID=1872118 RepID=UPI003CFE3FD4